MSSKKKFLITFVTTTIIILGILWFFIINPAVKPPQKPTKSPEKSKVLTPSPVESSKTELEERFSFGPKRIYKYFNYQNVEKLKTEEKELLEKLEKDPDNNDIRLDLAGVYFELQEFNKVMEEADKILKKDPDNRTATELKVFARFNRHEPYMAQELAKEALKKFPDDPIFLHVDAFATGLGDFKKGEEKYLNAIAKYPEYSQLYIGLADITHQHGESGYSLAEETLKEAIRKFPNDPMPYVYLADMYYDIKKDNPRAKELLEQALQVDPNYYQTHLWLGILAREDGEYKKAEKHLKRALELYPRKEIDAPYLQLGILYETLQQYDKAEENYYKATATFKDNLDKNIEKSDTFALLGKFYIHRGKLDLAEENILKAIKTYDNALETRRYLAAQIYFLKKQYEKADDYATKAYAGHIDDPDLTYGDIALLLAKIKLIRGEINQACYYRDAAVQEAKKYNDRRRLDYIKDSDRLIGLEYQKGYEKLKKSLNAKYSKNSRGTYGKYKPMVR